MSAFLAIGVGCRTGAAAAGIAEAVARVRAEAGASLPARLFTLDRRAGEPGLVAAAARLGLPLTPLPGDALAAVADAVATPSPAAERHLGLPSVSEAAALAGAGPGARLLVRRLVVGGVTVAAALPASPAGTAP